MTTRPRLFARTCEVNPNSEQLSSSKKFIILLLDLFSSDIHLRKELDHLSNCHCFRAYSINNCLDLIYQDGIKDGLILLIISTQFFNFVFDTLLEIVPQLSYIYLFDTTPYNQDSVRDLRLRGIFDNVQLLTEQIRQDIENFEVSTHKSKGIQYILEDSVTFFLVSILL
ncbi:unnamed protein product [Adineta steineri]|uniref:Uncharacterized protein n=1 Tax=Adineta steineri TaxID=433720 RepID=A0A819A9M0_9BILA|nr:unnamed protein product [Adineta steineri]CAF3784231.1 unnamed protein product [Adineta steineri]